MIKGGKTLGHRHEAAVTRSGASYDERRDWQEKVNGLLRMMRDADKAGRTEDAAKYGDEANAIFVMGPKKYSESKNRKS